MYNLVNSLFLPLLVIYYCFFLFSTFFVERLVLYLVRSKSKFEQAQHGVRKHTEYFFVKKNEFYFFPLSCTEFRSDNVVSGEPSSYIFLCVVVILCTRHLHCNKIIERYVETLRTGSLLMEGRGEGGGG